MCLSRALRLRLTVDVVDVLPDGAGRAALALGPAQHLLDLFQAGDEHDGLRGEVEAGHIAVLASQAGRHLVGHALAPEQQHVPEERPAVRSWGAGRTQGSYLGDSATSARDWTLKRRRFVQPITFCELHAVRRRDNAVTCCVMGVE